MAPDSDILFSGIPQIPSSEVFQQASDKNPLWFKLFEQAYKEFAALPENKGVYAGSDGATLEQAWLVFTLFGIEPQCVLVREMPVEAVARISTLTHLSAPELMELLKKLQAARGELNVSTLYYDGRTGHAIRLTAYHPDSDRFVYHDPWPLKSLLCAENNDAGIEAQPEGSRWSVTAAELEQVIFASFIFQTDWATIHGVKYELFYKEWEQGEFYKFFHLVKLESRPQQGGERRLLAPQNFREEVSVIIGTSAEDQVRDATLILDRKWLAQNFMLGIDVTASFVKCFGPAPETPHYNQLYHSLRSLQKQESRQAAVDQGPTGSDVNRLLLCFLGAPVEARFPGNFSALVARNVHDDKRGCFELNLSLN